MGGDGNIPLWGKCSTCENVTFPPNDKPSSQIEQTLRLNVLFDSHFQKVHMREDASQAAARIVREATKE